MACVQDILQTARDLDCTSAHEIPLPRPLGCSRAPLTLRSIQPCRGPTIRAARAPTPSLTRPPADAAAFYDFSSLRACRTRPVVRPRSGLYAAHRANEDPPAAASRPNPTGVVQFGRQLGHKHHRETRRTRRHLFPQQQDDLAARPTPRFRASGHIHEIPASRGRSHRNQGDGP